MRLALISDTHLSRRARAFTDNLNASLAWIADANIDLVINLGDVSLDGANSPGDLDYAGSLFSAAPMRLLAVPGNHDIGEAAALPRSAGEAVLNARALEGFRSAIGPDRWSIVREGWQLIGLNAQLYGSGSDDEAAQDNWLDEVLNNHNCPLGIFLHKPLFRDSPDTAERHQRYLPPTRAISLLAQTAKRDLRFVAAGHTHQYRRISFDGVEHIWAPSLAYVIPDTLQERIGEKVVGMLLLEIDADHRFEVIVPLGLAHHDLADCGALYPELVSHRPRP